MLVTPFKLSAEQRRYYNVEQSVTRTLTLAAVGALLWIVIRFADVSHHRRQVAPEPATQRVRGLFRGHCSGPARRL
jgi:hypothetical protein